MAPPQPHDRVLPLPQDQAQDQFSTPPTQPWWQTWYAVIPGLLLCAPLGLIGLWRRKHVRPALRVVLTALSIGVLTLSLPMSGTVSPTGAHVDQGPTVTAALTLPSPLPPTTPTSDRSDSPSAAPTAEMVAAPRLSGLSLAAAQAQLTRLGLSLGKVTRQPSTKAVGTVLSQAVAGGTSLRPGTRVDLVVASPVPKVVSDKPNCTPGYSPCLPPASDYDCAGGSGNGPKYVQGPVYVTGSDPYGLDRDHDGVGCES